MADDVSDDARYVEVLDDVLLTIDEAAALLDWLKLAPADIFRKTLARHRDSRMMGTWQNLSADMPTIDRERGRSMAYTEIAELHATLKVKIMEPLNRKQAQSEGYRV
jgi:hypothetical protein